MVIIFLSIALCIAIIWLIAITIQLRNFTGRYQIVTKHGDTKDLTMILEGMMKEQHTAHAKIAELVHRCDTIEKDNLAHIQKIGLLRFNPFKDTGGDQSFTLALLDAKDSGIVISGLYSRSGTRWYAKKIVETRGADHELSDEEQQAVKMAKPFKA